MPIDSEAFRIHTEAAEHHLAAITGTKTENFRGGLLRAYRELEDLQPLARQIASDVAASVSSEIAVSKLHLARAAISLEESQERRRLLLNSLRAAILDRPGPVPGDRVEALLTHSATVAARRVALPLEVRNTNAMLPNRPLAGWEREMEVATAGLFRDLSLRGLLFVEQLRATERPRKVALKLDLNMGIEGSPSVSDPAVTGAVIFELLERGFSKGAPLHITVGDSCGIENAPVGRTAMDILRETGNYHHAIKAALRFVLRHDPDMERREAASNSLNNIAALEAATPPVFFGSPGDRLHRASDFAQAEALASPWVRCVDYDDTGFVAVRTDPGLLGLAVWGTRDFHIARPWVEADYRVHVTRGASTHLFAGWTGSLKGLIGLHALGMRPADQGMNERGQSVLDFMVWIMHTSGFQAVIRGKAGLADVPEAEGPSPAWERLKSGAAFAKGWAEWIRRTRALEGTLRRELREGAEEPAIMARMRRDTRAILLDCDRIAPGFRNAMWVAVAEGTRTGLLTAWKFRELVPATMRDERMGLRIGVLTQAPMQSDLVVQGLPKIGLGGGPDAYAEVRDVGVVVAGTDQVSVDLTALRLAAVPGNPWAFNCPIHGALQLGRGPTMWDEIEVISQVGQATV